MSIMTDFMLGLYGVSVCLSILWLIRSITKGERKLWARVLKLTAIMSVVAFGLMTFYNSLQVPSTDADMKALTYLGEFIVSGLAGVVFIILWIITLVAGLIRFKKNNP